MTTMEMAKITFNLVSIYLIGGLILAFVYAKTSPIMYQKAKAEKEAALQTMMPEAEKIDKIGDWEPHEKEAEYYVARKCGEVRVNKVKDEETGVVKEEKECVNPSNIGYIVEGYGKGYSSYINLLVSVNRDFVVQKVKILHHGETPGLGDEIEKDYFLNQLKGKNLNDLVVVKAETEDKVQAITGATISSRAVTEDGVKNGVEMIRKKAKGEVKTG